MDMMGNFSYIPFPAECSIRFTLAGAIPHSWEELPQKGDSSSGHIAYRPHQHETQKPTSFHVSLYYADVIYIRTSSSNLLHSVFDPPQDLVPVTFIVHNYFILYDKVGWSSLRQRLNTRWYLLIYKTLTGKLPYYLLELLCHSDGLYQTCFAGRLFRHVSS